MLIIAGTITTAGNGRQQFLTAVQPMVAATLIEDGCHEYAFTPDPNDEHRILLSELWEDEKALDSHFASAHMAAWQHTRKTLPITGADLKKYTISKAEAL